MVDKLGKKEKQSLRLSKTDALSLFLRINHCRGWLQLSPPLFFPISSFFFPLYVVPSFILPLLDILFPFWGEGKGVNGAGGCGQN